MAATFVVEDGSGVTGANSYASEAAATAYMDNTKSAATWTAVSDKEMALREGTRYLDAAYGHRWRGRRGAIDNPLDWPRTGAADNDHYTFPLDEIPTELIEATAEAALRADSDTLTPDLTADTSGIKRVRKKLDVLEIETEYQPAAGQFKTFTVIERILRDLIEPAGRILDRA